ncbi:DUF5666 domain-containing protein [Candidatus Kaiserbacteria bacterium]|nr:DUF5666 domain-containing protein [Candidatus Kaiserbacteria bacterium]
MNNKTIAIIACTAVVFCGIGYFAGKSGANSSLQSGAGQRFAGSGTFATRTGARAANSGAVFGTIISKDASSITVQLSAANATSTNGTSTGSRIVLVNPSTEVDKTVQGTTGDLNVGQSVMVAGTPNSDGSVTATSVQIRPSGSPRGR